MKSLQNIRWLTLKEVFVSKKEDPHEILMDHDEVSEDESIGDLEGSDPDPEAIEDADYDLDDLVMDDDEFEEEETWSPDDEKEEDEDDW